MRFPWGPWSFSQYYELQMVKDLNSLQPSLRFLFNWLTVLSVDTTCLYLQRLSLWWMFLLYQIINHSLVISLLIYESFRKIPLSNFWEHLFVKYTTLAHFFCTFVKQVKFKLTNARLRAFFIFYLSFSFHLPSPYLFHGTQQRGIFLLLFLVDVLLITTQNIWNICWLYFEYTNNSGITPSYMV